MDQEARTQLTNLMSAVRWSTLATTNADGSPLASEIAFACLRADGLVVHLSQLAKHTRNLMERPQFSLSVSEPWRQKSPLCPPWSENFQGSPMLEPSLGVCEVTRVAGVIDLVNLAPCESHKQNVQ